MCGNRPRGSAALDPAVATWRVIETRPLWAVGRACCEIRHAGRRRFVATTKLNQQRVRHRDQRLPVAAAVPTRAECCGVGESQWHRQQDQQHNPVACVGGMQHSGHENAATEICPPNSGGHYCAGGDCTQSPHASALTWRKYPAAAEAICHTQKRIASIKYLTSDNACDSISRRIS